MKPCLGHIDLNSWNYLFLFLSWQFRFIFHSLNIPYTINAFDIWCQIHFSHGTYCSFGLNVQPYIWLITSLYYHTHTTNCFGSVEITSQGGKCLFNSELSCSLFWEKGEYNKNCKTILEQILVTRMTGFVCRPHDNMLWLSGSCVWHLCKSKQNYQNISFFFYMTGWFRSYLLKISFAITCGQERDVRQFWTGTERLFRKIQKFPMAIIWWLAYISLGRCWAFHDMNGTSQQLACELTKLLSALGWAAVSSVASPSLVACLFVSPHNTKSQPFIKAGGTLKSACGLLYTTDIWPHTSC